MDPQHVSKESYSSKELSKDRSQHEVEAEQIHEIEQRYLELEKQLASQNGTDEELEQLRKQHLDEIYRLPVVQQRGVYNSLEGILQDSFSESAIDQIGSGEELQTVLNRDMELCEVRTSLLIGTSLSVIRIINITQNHNQELAELSSKSDDATYYRGFSVESVIVFDQESGKYINLGERVPCTLEAIREHPADEAESKIQEALDNPDAAYPHTQQLIYRPTMHNKNRDAAEAIYPTVKTMDDLTALLHEVGHAWDKFSRPYSFNGILIDNSGNINWEKFNDVIAIRERNAWAWAIRELRSWRQGNIHLTPEQFSHVQALAEYCLSTYELGNINESDDIDIASKKFTNTSRKYELLIKQANGIYNKLINLTSLQDQIRLNLSNQDGATRRINVCKYDGYFTLSESVTNAYSQEYSVTYGVSPVKIQSIYNQQGSGHDMRSSISHDGLRSTLIERVLTNEPDDFDLEQFNNIQHKIQVATINVEHLRNLTDEIQAQLLPDLFPEDLNPA